MKKINILKTVVLFTFLIVSTSCNDFLDDAYQSPNNPTFSTPSLTLAVAEQDFLNLNGRQMNYLGNFMVYNWTTPSNWSANENLIKYIFTTSSYNFIFGDSYSAIFKNLTYIENYKKEGVDYTAYKIISKVIKGFQYQYLVDLYGDVPYTEANLRAENLTPKYDDAATIYKDLIDKLTEAAISATNLPKIYEKPSTQDIIFGGDMQKWAQFANTIKLRLLIRLSGTGQNAYITSEIAKIKANGAGYVTEDVTGNPGYSDNDNQQNPFFGYQGSAAGQSTPGKVTKNDRNNFTVATDYTINYLGTTNDPRRDRIYSEAKSGGGYHGAEQLTLLPSSGFTTDDLSQVGPGLLIDSKQDQPIMLAAESLLLQSEAMVRGFMPGGMAGAKTKYEEAITASFVSLGVEKIKADPTATPPIEAKTVEERATEYYNQALPNVGWDASANKLQAIATQKWVALNGVCGIESWIEYTRNGFPSNLPIPKEAKSGKRPLGLFYPDTEISRNANNVPKQTQDAIFTNKPFWKN